MVYQPQEFALLPFEDAMHRLAGTASRRFNETEFTDLTSGPVDTWDLDALERQIKWLTSGNDDLTPLRHTALTKLESQRNTINSPAS